MVQAHTVASAAVSWDRDRGESPVRVRADPSYGSLEVHVDEQTDQNVDETAVRTGHVLTVAAHEHAVVTGHKHLLSDLDLALIVVAVESDCEDQSPEKEF